jgi:hypothetical protein
MKLDEALRMLKEGRCISRKVWSESEGYLILMKGMKNIWKIITIPGPNAGNHIFSYDELCADDWEEYSEAKFVVEKDSSLEIAA